MSLAPPLQPRPGRRTTRTDGLHVLVTIVVAGLVGQLGLAQWVRPEMVLFVAPAVAVAVLVFRHPKWCVVGIVAGAIFGTYRSGFSLGAFTLRPADVFLALLTGWALHLRIREGRRPTSRVGQLQVGLLLFVFGMSLLTTVGDPKGLLEPLSSLLRLVLTFVAVWFVPYAIRDGEDRMFLLRTTAVLITAELVRAIFFEAHDGGRLSGANGPNVEGLLAVLLLVAVLNLPLFERRIRVGMGMVATLALIQSGSIASVTALVLVLGIYGIQLAGGSARARALIRPARMLMLIVGGFLLVASLRPDDVPQGSGFDSSSTAIRVTLGYAGLTVFGDHPILGVGWQRSASAVSSEAVVAKVRERFSRVRTDVLRAGNSNVTVHNAYIQILAESGLVGFTILMTGILVGRRGIRVLVAQAGLDREVARTLAVSLTVILIWWNDNALFGAQPEAVLFACFLGLLASIRPQPPARPVAGLKAVPDPVPVESATSESATSEAGPATGRA